MVVMMVENLDHWMVEMMVEKMVALMAPLKAVRLVDYWDQTSADQMGR